jgi:hypothetical protein
MLLYRATDRAIDDMFPDVVKGIAGAENIDMLSAGVQETRQKIDPRELMEEPEWKRNASTSSSTTKEEPSASSATKKSASSAAKSAPTTRSKRKPAVDSKPGPTPPSTLSPEELKARQAEAYEAWKELKDRLGEAGVKRVRYGLQEMYGNCLIYPALDLETWASVFEIAEKVLKD